MITGVNSRFSSLITELPIVNKVNPAFTFCHSEEISKYSIVNSAISIRVYRESWVFINRFVDFEVANYCYDPNLCSSAIVKIYFFCSRYWQCVNRQRANLALIKAHALCSAAEWGEFVNAKLIKKIDVITIGYWLRI